MEDKLKALFSYQEFEKDSELQKLLIETDEKYSCLLAESELEFAVGGVPGTSDTRKVGDTIRFITVHGEVTAAIAEVDTVAKKYRIDDYGWIEASQVID